MSFPTNPTNGQKANVNGVTYIYSTTIGAWTVSSMFNQGITANVVAANTFTATNSFSAPSITANTFTGDANASSLTSGTVPSGRIAGSYTGITTVGSLSGLTVNGTVSSQHMNPTANNTYDLGTSALRWRNIYTQDLHLNNGIGDWTVVEGEEDLFLYNNKRNRVYKFVLMEIDPSEATPKINELNKKS